MHLSRTDARTTGRRGWQTSWWGVIALAVGASILVRVLAEVAGIDVAVTSGSSEHVVGVVDVMFGSAVPALVGAIVLHLMARRHEKALAWWTVGADISLVASLLSPLGAVSVQAWAVLTLLHLTTGLIVINGLRRAGTGAPMRHRTPAAVAEDGVA